MNAQAEIIVDNFAGGGGASLGIEMALGRAVDIAINHDREAIAMHAANHANTRHFCEDVWDVDPIEAAGGRPVGLAWFSPDCTFHSKARGGKPFRDPRRAKRRRGLAWVVIKWAKLVRPRVIMLENVEEFQNWGPLLEDGRPCPLRKGFTFRRWWRQLEKLGYRIEMNELRASDYGTPTIRRRLFIIARRDGQPIRWPSPTHGPGLAPYRTAAECIDWSLPCPSIFERKRPLAEATLRRIARGIRRFVLDAAEPFIVKNMTNNTPRAAHEPLSTILTGNHHYLATPFVSTYYGDKRPTDVRGIRLDQPLPTQTTENRHALVMPFVTEHANASTQRNMPADEPLRTQCAQVKGGHFALVSAFLAKHYGGHETPGQMALEPMSTVTTQDHHAVVAGHLLNMKGSDRRMRPLDAPAPTVCAGGTHAALVAALMAPYYGQGSGVTGRDLRDPTPTITTKDRLQLVTVTIDGESYVLTDIGMRMLGPRELYRAQGFPDSYVIDPKVNGKRLSKAAQVRMCGNSVCPQVAAAIVTANFSAAYELEEKRA